jgi:hypothetical protein
MKAKAQQRVLNEDKLYPHYYSMLIEYEWDNYDEHIEWVATAPIDEILDWCEGIRTNEDQL